MLPSFLPGEPIFSGNSRRLYRNQPHNRASRDTLQVQVILESSRPAARRTIIYFQMKLWIIPLLPLLGFLINGILGRRFSNAIVSAVGAGSVVLSFAWVLKTLLGL